MMGNFGNEIVIQMMLGKTTPFTLSDGSKFEMTIKRL
ncbi:hypothetical protein FT12353_02200 [Fructobacillus tropaeoli]|nr:hypothetical protein FT12353_02200 [Fructobacillus tropaeoli]